MHRLLMIAAVAALAGCSREEAPPAVDANLAADANLTVDANLAVTNDTNMAAAAPLGTLNETSWEFTDDGKAMVQSIDAAGKYIVKAGAEHIDHGTAVMKEGKACFTSAMDKEGEECWTDPGLAVGASGEAVSDKGEKVTIKRIAYAPLTM